jgi:SAM-dependent methyltransferase
MTEMNPVSRFFVNLSAARRSSRAYDWVRKNAAIPAAATCLELGCGNAYFATRFVAGFHPKLYVATDFDPHQLTAAEATVRKRFGDSPPSSLLLRQADMLHLPFENGSFDVVLAFVAIHHASPNHFDFTPIPQALAEIDRALRPRGLLVYQEILHKEAIRGWLADHAYSLDQIHRGWRIESVVARKS